jgi:gliding motility associated protien GldN
MRTLLFTLILISNFPLIAQPASGVLDGIYIRENARGRKPVTFNHASEINLMWMKRVTRVLDLREKINHPFYYPLETSNGMSNLITVLRSGICSNELTAFDPISDEFLYVFRGEEACKLGELTDTMYVPNEDGEIEAIEVNEPFKTENVLRYRIKEDWFFDSKRSVMEARIIGICPIEEVHDENGEYKGDRPLYWLYMPEIRHVLSNSETPNRHNDVERRTYDDLFNKRFFSSYIYQASNVQGRKIQDYKTGLDALLEGKRIENSMFDYEQDLWEY